MHPLKKTYFVSINDSELLNLAFKFRLEAVANNNTSTVGKLQALT